MSLAAMPGILVILTLGYLTALHVGQLLREGALPGPLDALESRYQEAGARMVRDPVARIRGRLGLEANGVVQREGELYYGPDIEHVTGRSFLARGSERSHVVLKREGWGARGDDPVAAIIDYGRKLRERGIQLVLLPTPSKAMFARPGGDPMRNEGFSGFLKVMEEHEIPLFDPTPHMQKFAQGGDRLFLRTDSHWTPRAMRMTATYLGAFLWREGLLPDVEPETFTGDLRTISNSGDLARLITGRVTEQGWETVEIHSVRRGGSRGSDPERWEADPDSPVLLLGDSFTNVFSLEEMGWGTDAGLAEALSQTMGISIDRVARNADGAFASREELRALDGRLRGKRLVIWQFAARELSLGDWKFVSLPGDDAETIVAIEERHPEELEGTIAMVAPIPPLNRAPYRRAVMEVHLRDLSSPFDRAKEVVVMGWGVQDRMPTAMTNWQRGQRMKLRVVPWSVVQTRYGRLHRLPLDDPDYELLDLERFWIVDDDAEQE